MNSTENYECPSLTCQSPNFIPAQCVARVNSNANNVAGRNGREIQLLQRFVNDYGIAEARRCRSGEDIQPPRRNNADAKGFVTRVDEVNCQAASLNAATAALAAVTSRSKMPPAHESDQMLFVTWSQSANKRHRRRDGV